MAVVTNPLKANGTIIQAPTGPGEASTLVYGFDATITNGATGKITQYGIKPFRSFPDDTWVAQPAQVGHPCSVFVAPNGQIVLVLFTEVYGVVDCAAEEGNQ